MGGGLHCCGGIGKVASGLDSAEGGASALRVGWSTAFCAPLVVVHGTACGSRRTLQKGHHGWRGGGGGGALEVVLQGSAATVPPVLPGAHASPPTSKYLL